MEFYRMLAICVRTHASGIPAADNFVAVELPRPEPAAGSVLVQVLLLSIDPAMRGWISTEPNYLKVGVGEVMRSFGIGRVTESGDDRYRAGDLVYGLLGWSEFFLASGDDIYWQVEPEVAPLAKWMGMLGLNGVTAWLGLRHLARPRAGETVLVTTAAGAVGSIVGQLARIDGLEAVGLTGSAQKAELAMRDFGYARMIDYRGCPDLAAAIAEATPMGVDIFFDNVAGTQADAVFERLNTNARVIQCGTASLANWSPWPQGPRRERQMLVKRLSWHGFVMMDHRALWPTALEDLKQAWSRGLLVSNEECLEGLSQAPSAIERLYKGENSGKLMIRVQATGGA
jgi:NADPH-dependent curcumin reductase